MRFLLVVSCVCWSVVSCPGVTFRGALTNLSSSTVWMRLYRISPTPGQAQSASHAPGAGRYVGTSAWVAGDVVQCQVGTDSSFATVLDSTAPVTLGASDVDQVLVWTGSVSPSVTNTLHSVCITNRSPLPRAVLVQVGSGAFWEVVSSQNLIVLSSGQEWCASYVLEGPPDATAVCAVLVDPGSLASPFIAAWGRVCGSQSITTNPPTGTVVTGTISSPPLSNRLASVYGTNVAGMLSSTGALTGENLGAFLAGMTDLTGAGLGAGGSASGVTGGGSWTNAGISGGVSNGVPWDGSNIVSAVGHLEASLTNSRVEWEGTNGWAESASSQYQLGANTLGGAWQVGSNSFATAAGSVRDIGHGWDSDVADTALDVRLRNLTTQTGQGSVLNAVGPSFDPWSYAGFRRVCALLKRFLIWFGAFYCLKVIWNRCDKLVRGALMLPDLSGGSNVVVAFMGIGGSTTAPAGLIRAAIFAGGFGVLVTALTAFAGDVTVWLDNPFVADGGTVTAFGSSGASGGGISSESVWYCAWVWVNRVCPVGVWMVQAYELAVWWFFSCSLFTFFAGGHRFIRI